MVMPSCWLEPPNPVCKTLSLITMMQSLLTVRLPVCLLVYFSADRSAHEVLRGDAKLLAPEETPEEVIREREQRAAQLVSVQDKLKAAAAGAHGVG